MTLATSFGCPYEGPIDQDAVVEVARRAAQAGAASIGLADTIGVAMPTEVATLVERVVDVTGMPIGAHLHDTRGLALANALVAIEHGATRLDAAVGGLGGCPFAPGASGNLPIEDLVHALEGMGVDTGCSVDGADRSRPDGVRRGRPAGRESRRYRRSEVRRAGTVSRMTGDWLTSTHVAVVAGKGGVGSSTVAAAMALAAARQGADVLFVAVDGRPGMGPLLGGPSLDDTDRILQRIKGPARCADGRSRRRRPSVTTST